MDIDPDNQSDAAPDTVDEASRESFPASDPPAWAMVNGHEDVSDNPAEHQFEVHRDGRTAFLAYRRTAEELILRHTDVPTELAGHGLGGKLARAALDFARRNNLRVVAQCPFVVDYIKRHPDYADLVVK